MTPELFERRTKVNYKLKSNQFFRFKEIRLMEKKCGEALKIGSEKCLCEWLKYEKSSEGGGDT